MNAIIMLPKIKAEFIRKKLVANMRASLYVHEPIVLTGVDGIASRGSCAKEFVQAVHGETDIDELTKQIGRQL